MFFLLYTSAPEDAFQHRSSFVQVRKNERNLSVRTIVSACSLTAQRHTTVSLSTELRILIEEKRESIRITMQPRELLLSSLIHPRPLDKSKLEKKRHQPNPTSQINSNLLKQQHQEHLQLREFRQREPLPSFPPSSWARSPPYTTLVSFVDETPHDKRTREGRT